MNTSMTGFRWFFENLCILVLWTEVASALEGLGSLSNWRVHLPVSHCYPSSSFHTSTLRSSGRTFCRNSWERKRLPNMVSGAIAEILQTLRVRKLPNMVSGAIAEILQTLRVRKLPNMVSGAIAEILQTLRVRKLPNMVSGAIAEILQTLCVRKLPNMVSDAIAEIYCKHYVWGSCQIWYQAPLQKYHKQHLLESWKNLWVGWKEWYELPLPKYYKQNLWGGWEEWYRVP